ncbi:MAG: M48 family metallopeptidase [Deltaproteobacteria bacterium]|nr:M48 family metallopeptidase [Deltaproteobacteria bacterium]
MSISVTASGEVRVTLPYRGTVRQAKAFLCEKSAWVAAHRRKACLLRFRHKLLTATRRPVSRKNAEVILRERLDHLAREYGFSCNRVSIRNQKSRWGSCSADNNISLNQKITRLPNRLIDFVLLHELVHTRIKNHGKDFWLELGKYVDDVKTLRSEFRQYRLDLL